MISRAIKSHGFAGVGLLAAVALCGACAGSPPPHLVDAREAYQRAAKGPARELAPAQLHSAETVLKLAERTYEHEGDSDNARDRAYVAMRKAQLAEVQAQISQTNAELAQVQQRGEQLERQRQAATMDQLDQTRTQLEQQRRQMEMQSAQLVSEIQLREQAEAEQARALAALEDTKSEPRGTVITLSGSVIFPSGASELLPSARSRLSEVATALTASGAESHILIEGHTDSVGSDDRNEELSRQRAAAVKEWLVAQGVDASRVEIRGYGESRPIADNSTASGRANNRRVEIVVQSAEQRRAEQPTGDEIQPVRGSDGDDTESEQGPAELESEPAPEMEMQQPEQEQAPEQGNEPEPPQGP